MRKLVTIDRIVSKRPIPNADFIEIVKVRNWQCIAKKGEFEVGDPCVYAEIDSLFPMEERYSFLNRNGIKEVLINGVVHIGYRIRTMKLKGHISQGLALPLSFFKEELPTEVGTDITELLGVVKWEPEVSHDLEFYNQGVTSHYLFQRQMRKEYKILIYKTYTTNSGMALRR